MSSWLLLSERRIQQYVLGLLTIHMSLGCVRFLFPFQILNLGGDTVLISIASFLFSAGQIIGFLLLGRVIPSNRSRFVLGGLLLLLFIGSISISGSPLVITFARTFEGIGYGLIFLSIVSLASQFPDREGEAIGGLFAAVFSGLAIGQGVAGIFWSFLSEIGNFSSTQAIQFIAGLALIVIILSMVILRPAKSKGEANFQRWKWPHFHPRDWLRTILLFPSIALLLIVYSLYDFAHGLYTPNLSILLYQQGIHEINLSLAYFIGDITWGISQIFAGKLVDKVGFPFPLFLSLLLKGVVVIFYPQISFVLALFLILFLAGLTEGFLEPARNKAALSSEKTQNYIHSHVHLDLGFSSSGGFVLRAHKHEHKHESKPESFVGALQSIGILSFGFGSLFGSWLLLQGSSLETITIIGGLCLTFASFIGILFSFSLLKESKKKPNHNK